MNIDVIVDAEVKLPFPTSNPVPAAPDGILVTDTSFGWSLTVRPLAVLGPWILAIGFSLAVATVWKEHSAGIILFLAFAAAITLFQALFQTWGAYVLEINRTTVALTTQLLGLRRKKEIKLDQLRQIHLRADRGRRQVAETVELVGDRKVRFGADLSSEQRAYIAIILYQRLRERGD